MLRAPLLACLIGLTCSGLVSAQPPSNRSAPAGDGLQISAQMDHSKLKLGETGVLSLDLSYPAGLEVVLPRPETLTFPPFEVRDAVLTHLPTAGGLQKVRYTVRLAAYQDGPQTIGPLRVDYRSKGGLVKSEQSAPVSVDVQRVAGKLGDIHDLKAMEDVPTPLWMTVAAVTGVGVLLSLAALALLRRRRRLKLIPTTPDGLALQALDCLAAENLPAQGLFKLHYDRLAQILRTYLARRFELPVLENTTGEVVKMLGSAGLAESLCGQVGPILREADLAKFARQQVPAQQAQDRVMLVRGIIESTRPALTGKEA